MNNARPGQRVGSGGTPPAADAEVVDVVLTATRALIGLSTQSLGTLADDLSAAQYRALVVLAARGPQRMVDLAGVLEVNPSTVGRMCDRLVRKNFVRRNRAGADRRIVMVSLSTEGRRVLDEATAARRVLIIDALGALSIDQQRAAAGALRELSRALGEVPDHDWPNAEPRPPDQSERAGRSPRQARAPRVPARK